MQLKQYNIRDAVTVKRFHVGKFASIPFHLLKWGRTYIVENNCRYIYNNDLAKLPQYNTHYCSTHSKTFMSYPHETPLIADDMLGKVYISHAYYTESDTILYASNSTLMDFIIEATNFTTAFFGARKSKKARTSPLKYMEDVMPSRYCGTDGYVLDFPNSPVVRQQDTSPRFLRSRQWY